jgi:hypothetical protein
LLRALLADRSAWEEVTFDERVERPIRYGPPITAS